jgi:plastocyanin
MAKTYTAASTVSAGNVYTAAAHNIIVTDTNNLIVPATVRARLTGGKALTSGNAIPWDAISSPGWDTDSMWSSGASTRLTVTTPGVYLVSCNILTQVTVANSTSQTLTLRYANPGTQIFAEFTNPVTVAINGFPTMNVTTLINATTSGDYFEAVYSFTGGTHTALNDNRNSFSAVWVGRTS